MVALHENIYFQNVLNYFIKGTNHSNQIMMIFVRREFSSMRWKMMKEDLGVSSAQAWGCPMHPNKYSRRLKRLSLGMPPCIPFSINNHQFVHLHAIFLSLHMLCAMLGAYRSLLFSLFQFCLLFITSRNLAYLVWERHTLHSTLEHNIGFMLILFVCSSSFHSYCHAQLLVFMLIFLRAIIQVDFGTLLSYHAYLVQRVGSLH